VKCEKLSHTVPNAIHHMLDAPEGVYDYIGLVISCASSSQVHTENAMGGHAIDMSVARVIALDAYASSRDL
jgi:hypothetical protein